MHWNILNIIINYRFSETFLQQQLFVLKKIRGKKRKTKRYTLLIVII